MNIVFTFWLVQIFRQGGLGIANTMSAAFNVYLLLHALRRKLPKLELAELRRSVLAMLPAVMLAGLVAWGSASSWERLAGHETLAHRVAAVFVPMTLGALAYFCTTWWAKITQAREVLGLIAQRFRRTQA